MNNRLTYKEEQAEQYNSQDDLNAAAGIVRGLIVGAVLWAGFLWAVLH